MDNQIIRQEMFNYTRAVRRKTMGDYYVAVLADGKIVHKKCRHRHNTRLSAFHCALNTYVPLTKALNLRELMNESK